MCRKLIRLLVQSEAIRHGHSRTIHERCVRYGARPSARDARSNAAAWSFRNLPDIWHSETERNISWLVGFLHGPVQKGC